MNKDNKVMSIVSIVLGIASILWYFAEDTRFVPFVLAAIALVVAIIAFFSSKNELNTPALVISIVGIALTSARFIGCVACASCINNGLGSI